MLNQGTRYRTVRPIYNLRTSVRLGWAEVIRGTILIRSLHTKGLELLDPFYRLLNHDCVVSTTTTAQQDESVQMGLPQDTRFVVQGELGPPTRFLVDLLEGFPERLGRVHLVARAGIEEPVADECSALVLVHWPENPNMNVGTTLRGLRNNRAAAPFGNVGHVLGSDLDRVHVEGSSGKLYWLDAHRSSLQLKMEWVVELLVDALLRV